MTSVLDELKEQRRAVIEGKWVRRAPDKGESCLVYRDDCRVRLSRFAIDLVEEARQALFPANRSSNAMAWNDVRGRKLSEVVAVLDHAILLAKQAETDGAR